MNGNEFKQWRKNAALTLRDVQELSGVGFTTVKRFEDGAGIALSSYQKLEALANGKEPETQDKQAKIRFHLKQLEILTGSED